MINESKHSIHYTANLTALTHIL
uniref:Uncharacterized protein n=1 Tax=Rhizophora mucronata TaxID=61149 RepID=A0A2P2P1F5_RHIMU